MTWKQSVNNENGAAWNDSNTVVSVFHWYGKWYVVLGTKKDALNRTLEVFGSRIEAMNYARKFMDMWKG